MDELTRKLTQILNDPGSMKQIMDMAASLGIEAPEALTRSPQEMAQTVTETLQTVRRSEEKQQALMHALLPYLRPGRQARLEKAMELVRLSTLAGPARKHSTRLQQQEESHV